MRFKMFGRKRVFQYLMIVFLISALGPRLLPVNEASGAPGVWTVMVYLDGDNNLEPAAIKDFNEMEKAGGTTADVNIVTIFDRCAASYEAGLYAEDWSGTRYYEVRSDSDMNTINSLMVQDLGEQNMGDFNTLSNFVVWAKTFYPADKYALFLWDHGDGLNGMCFDEDNGDDYLDMYDLQRLPYSDLLCFDACIMGQMEVLYEVLNQCEYFGASSINVPNDGLDYTAFLSALIDTPTMGAEELGEIVCETYIDFYRYKQAASFCVYDTKDLLSIRTLFDSLSQVMIDDLATYKGEIYEARYNTVPLGFLYDCDFHGFLDNLQSIGSAAISTAASNFLTTLETALVISDTTLSSSPVGFTIFLPLVFYELTIVDYYNNVFNSVFMPNVLWDDFVMDWTHQLSTLNPQWSTWDSGGEYTGYLSEGEYALITASFPIDSSFQAILTFDENVDMSLHVWNAELIDGIVGGFYTYSIMPFDMPESAVFTINTVNPARMVFYIYCEKGSGNYALSTQNYISIVDDPYEDNDIITQATSLDVNSTYAFFGFDQDFYEIELEAGDSVDVALGFHGANNYDLYIYDKDTVMIEYSENYYVPEHISFIADYTGTYYIRVSPFDIYLEPFYVLGTRVISDEPPEITSVSHLPSNPEQIDQVTITCSVIDNNEVGSVILYYNTSSGWESIQLINTSPDSYIGTITNTQNATCIEYYIVAEDNYGHTVSSETNTIIYEQPEPEPGNTFAVSFMFSLLPIVLLVKRKKKT